MMRFLSTFLIVCCLCFTSCKKDLLHWQSATQLSSGTTHRLNRIIFVNDTLGLIAGGERFDFADILTTHDGGYTWLYSTFPSIGKGMYALAGTSDGNIYACGFEGTLMHSKDYGRNWDFNYQRYDAYKSMAICNNGNLIVIGGISFDYGFIQREDANGGLRSWDSLNFELNDVLMRPDGAGYVSGYGAAMRTTDNGETWQRQEVGKDNFKGLFALSSTDVWTCGFNGSIYHTTNGGADWQRMRNGNDLTIPRYHLESILFTDAQHGYAVGEQGVVIYTDDGGEHWSEFDRFTSQTLHSIVRCSNNDLIVCGDGGVLYRLQKK